MDQETIALGCGVKRHPRDCLCDVKIEVSAQIAYGFGPRQQVEGADDGFVHGSETPLLSGKYGRPWSSQNLAEYMEEFGAGWEAMRIQQLHEEIEQSRQETGRKAPQLRDQLRSTVEKYLQEGHSMLEIPSLTSVEHDDLMHVLFPQVNARFRKWSDGEWRRFEQLIAGPGPFLAADIMHGMQDYGWNNINGGSKAFGIEKLILMYGKTFYRCGNRPLDAINRLLWPMIVARYPGIEPYANELKRAGITLTNHQLRNRLAVLRARVLAVEAPEGSDIVGCAT